MYKRQPYTNTEQDVIESVYSSHTQSPKLPTHFHGPSLASSQACGGMDVSDQSIRQLSKCNVTCTLEKSAMDAARLAFETETHNNKKGFCGVTKADDPGDCEKSFSGSWKVNARDARWLTSMDACAARCELCRNCHYISCLLYTSPSPRD